MQQVLDVGCGSNHLFRLTRPGVAAPLEGSSSALGKLEIKWRGSLGEVGRLQTQQILGPPVPAKVLTVLQFPLSMHDCLQHQPHIAFKLCLCVQATAEKHYLGAVHCVVAEKEEAALSLLAILIRFTVTQHLHLQKPPHVL